MLRILSSLSVGVAVLVSQTALAQVDKDAETDIATLQQLLRGEADPRTFEVLSEAASNEQCVDGVTGQFVFCISVPGVPVTETEYREEWVTCLVYNPEKCCHEFKKRIDMVEVKVMKPVFEKKQFCVKLNVPLKMLRALSECDCESLPGTGLPAVLSGNIDSNPKSTLHAIAAPDEQGSLRQRKAVAVRASVQPAAGMVATGSIHELPAPSAVHSEDALYGLGLARPESGQASELRMANTLSATIGVERFTFTPTGKYRVAGDQSGARVAGATSIVIDESNRLGDTDGLEYEVKLASPLVIEPDNSHTVTVCIANDELVGWGLVGTLTAVGERGERTERSDFRVVYVPSS